MRVRMPPLGAGAYLGIDRKSLSKRGIDYENHTIVLSDFQVEVIKQWSEGHVNPVNLWAAFGARNLSPRLEGWFQEVMEEKDG